MSDPKHYIETTTKRVIRRRVGWDELRQALGLPPAVESIALDVHFAGARSTQCLRGISADSLSCVWIEGALPTQREKERIDGYPRPFPAVSDD